MPRELVLPLPMLDIGRHKDFLKELVIFKMNEQSKESFISIRYFSDSKSGVSS